MSPALNHPKLQVSVQRFFEGVSWSGQIAPMAATPNAIIQTFHPTSESTAGDTLSLMRSVRGFMSNIPWTGTAAPQIVVSRTATASSAPTDLDAFSDFF